MLFLLVLLTAAPVHGAISCMDMNNNPVDWSVLLSLSLVIS